jgi:hypothetical protein
MGKFFDIAGFHNPAKGCMGIALLFVSSALFSAEVENMSPVASAKVPEAKHVFSMSCKVTAVNGDLATAEGRAKAIAWWKKYGFTKLWLESYRHGERVPTEKLVEERDAFRAEGFEVCGMITPTMLNDTEPGKDEPQMVVCWSDRRRGSACARNVRARRRSSTR